MTLPAHVKRIVVPFQIPTHETVPDLDLIVKIETPSGWIYLEDEENGYTLHSDSRGSKQITQRKQSSDNSWTPGSYDSSAVKGDVVETIAVWVEGASEFEFLARMQALEDAFSQLSYRFMWRSGNAVEYWTCKAADYSITRQREFQHAYTGFINARVPHLPQVASGLATSDDT